MSRTVSSSRYKYRTFSGFLKFYNNGVDNRITPTTKISVTNTNDFSCGMWVYLFRKPNGYTGYADNHTIYNNDLNYGGNTGYVFEINGYNGNFNVFAGNTGYISSSNVITYERLSHIALTLTGTTLKGYVNGNLVWTQTITRKNVGTLSPTCFGTESTGAFTSRRRILGYFTEPFACNKCLTADEVASVMDGNLTTTVLGATSVAYALSEGSGTSLTDATGNGNTGTLFSATNAWFTNAQVNAARSTTTRYDFPKTQILDNFDRADAANLGSKWTDGYNGFDISSKSAAPEIAGDYSITTFNTVNSSANQECYCTLKTVASNEKLGLYVRWNNAAGNGYGLTAHFTAGGNYMNLYRTDNYVDTGLSTTNMTFASGDKIGLRANGSTIEAWYKSVSGNWQLISSVTDSTYSNAGQFEIVGYGTTVRMDDFGGGAIPSRTLV
jgi:hypothetical protein